MPDGERAIDRPGLLNVGLQKARKLASGQIARASAFSLSVTLIGLAVAFVQAVLTARLLGATNYGTVAVATAVVQILAVLSLSGFADLAVREIARRIAGGDRGGTASFLRHAVLIVLTLSVAGAVVLAFAASAPDVVRPEYRTTLEIGSLLVVPIAFIGLFRGAAQGFGRIVQAQAPGELVRPTAMVLLMGTVAVLGLRFGPADYMWLALAAALIAAVIAALWLVRSEWASLRAEPGREPGAAGLVAALPFLGLGLTGMLQAQINTLLLGWLASPHEAGLFQPIVRLAPLFTLAGQAAGMRYASRIAEHWQKGEKDRIRWVTRTFTWTTSLLTLVVALAIAGSGPWLMRIFGPEFREVAPLLWIVAGAQLFNAACGPVGYLLTMSGAGARALAGQLAGLAINAFVGVLLIPTYGALAAAIAMASGIVVWNLAMLAMVRARYRFDPTLAGVMLRGKGLG